MSRRAEGASGAVADAERSARVFDALGDGTRLALVARLCEEPSLSISELAEGHEISRQAVTKHLGVLTRAGLVKSVRRGRERRFVLELRALDRARRYLDGVSRRWDEALGRLKALAEDGAAEGP